MQAFGAGVFGRKHERSVPYWVLNEASSTRCPFLPRTLNLASPSTYVILIGGLAPFLTAYSDHD